MTRRITIAGIIFNVEPIGYEILKAYQNAWNQRNPRYKKLWEEQAAEHLLQQLTKEESVTTLDHVEGINKVLPEIPIATTPIKKEGNFLLQIAMGLW